MTTRQRVALLTVCASFAWACNPNSRESINHMNQGIELAQSGSPTQAIAELEKALQLDETNHQAAYTLGQVLIGQKQWDKASDALTKAVKYGDGDPMYHYQLGHSFFEQDKLDMARTELERAIQIEPRLYKAHYYLGMVHIGQDHPADAAKAFTQACTLNPGFGKPAFELGKLYFNWDFFDEAVKVLTIGSEYAREEENRTNIFYYLGRAYRALGQDERAIDAFEKALAERKDNMEARLDLGIAYADKGEKAKARKLLEEFIQQGGGSSAQMIQAANDRLMKLAQQ